VKDVKLAIVAGSASRALGAAIAAELDVEPAACDIARFPDGELRPGVGGLAGCDAYVVQSTGPPVNENLVELLLLVDACRRGGAARVTAVLPYLCYARQDRRGETGQALGGRVVADAIVSAGADRAVVVDPHTPAAEAMFGIPTETVSAVGALAAAAAGAGVPDDAVVVAPDLGAAKLARRYGEHLGLPVAVVHKRRLNGEDVRVEDVTGDVSGRQPLVVDDMISTGGTIQGAIDAVVARGARSDAIVAATHGLLVGPAPDRLAALSIRRLFLADTVTSPAVPGMAVEVVSVAAGLAAAVARLHAGTRTDDLLALT
jgi:ribose-phosphate pyrophosphokinase